MCIRGRQRTVSFLFLLSVFAGPSIRSAANVITSTRDFQLVARLTGTPGSSSINPTWEVGIGGTDLGLSVNHRGKTYFLFGDTFASEATAGSGGPDWRNNVMAYSTDANPADGITFDGWITRPNGTARQVITPGNQPVTYIPTGAVSVGDNLYAWYMHVSDWNGWTLSHAGLGRWREGDNQFTIVPGYQFAAPGGGAYTSGNGTTGPGNFGMVAASYRSPLENSSDNHIYIWGTPGGREGGVKLARVLPDQIENLSAYQYFDGFVNATPQWTHSEFDGEKIFSSGVGEMSVMYNEAARAWTMMYISGGPQPDFELRYAQNPWGPWSEPVRVARFNQAPGLYSPYMNPLYVEDGGRTVYFTMSLWDPYDVYLAKVTLDVAPRTHWKGGNGLWTQPLNWNPGVPAATDHVLLENNAAVFVTSAAAAGRVDIGAAQRQGGRITVSSSGQLNVHNGAIRLGQASGSSGELVITGGTVNVAVDVGSLSLAGIKIGESGHGTLHLQSGQLNVPGRAWIAEFGGSRGELKIDGGAATIGGDLSMGKGDARFSQSGGVTTIGGRLNVFQSEVDLTGGSLNAAVIANLNGGTFNFTGGTLSVGKFEGNLVNGGGVLAPGHSSAAATITGSYSQEATATLAIAMGGLSRGTQYGALDVAAALTLDGGLAVSLVDGFVPAAGDVFDILNFGSIAGEFAEAALPGLDNHLRWDLSQLYTTGEISVAFLGDFNRDNRVDSADLALWNAALGLDDRGDADGDGDTDGVDFLAWQHTLGMSRLSEQSAATPEPAGAVLLTLAFVGVASTRLNRRHASRNLVTSR